MLVTTVQQPGAEAYESQISIHTSTENIDISLARESQNNLSDTTRAHGLLDPGKCIKRSIKQKWNEREYHVQYRKDVSHVSVKMSCATNQLP